LPSHAAGAVSGDEFAQVVTVLAEDFFVNRMRPVGFPAITPHSPLRETVPIRS